MNGWIISIFLIFENGRLQIGTNLLFCWNWPEHLEIEIIWIVIKLIFLSRSLKQQFLVLWRAAVLHVVKLYLWHFHYFIIQRLLDCIFIVCCSILCAVCEEMSNELQLSLLTHLWLLLFTSEVHSLIKMALSFLFNEISNWYPVYFIFL